MDTKIKDHLKPVLQVISWRQFARQYFHKSASWMYHKIDGIDEMTEQERLQFKNHLLTLSETLKDVASNI